MILPSSPHPIDPAVSAARIADERARLVRLCATLARDAAAAEDLAQEVVVEALRLRHRLYDLHGLTPWLNAVARNVCARWTHRRGQGHVPLRAGADAAAVDAEPVAAGDVELELERHELADLLDRALALLPPPTRAVLVARYIDETPHAEIAQQLRMSLGAVTMRLQRGRAALRRVLSDELRAEAAAYGLAEHADAMQPTGIWCPLCGSQRLTCAIERASGQAHFACPACTGGAQRPIASLSDRVLLAELRSPKAILSRQIQWLHGFYRQALDHRAAPCLRCGARCTLVWHLPADAPTALWGAHGFAFHCPACAQQNVQPLHYLVLDLPAVQHFWRTHPRMRLAGERLVTHDGRDQSVIAFESVTGSARIEVVSALDTFAVLHVAASP